MSGFDGMALMVIPEINDHVSMVNGVSDVDCGDADWRMCCGAGCMVMGYAGGMEGPECCYQKA